MSATQTRLRTPAGGRGNLWLAVLALLQVGALVLVLLTVARPQVTSTGPLLGKNVTTSDITAFSVTGSNGAGVDLKRDGIRWVLPKRGGYPAQASRVKSFLQQLTALQRSGLVATTKDAYKRLKVSSTTYQRKIVLTLKGGGTKTLYIGSEPSYGSTHVRLASDNGVYVTHSLHASDARTDASGYVDTTVLNLKPSTVERLEVKNANGDFVFTKGSNGWSLSGLPSGKKLDGQTVSTLVGSLTDLQLNEPLGKTAKPAYGLAKPTAVITLTTVKATKKAAAGGSAATGAGSASGSSASSGGASSGGASSGAASGAAGSASSGGTSSSTGSSAPASAATSSGTTSSASGAASSASGSSSSGSSSSGTTSSGTGTAGKAAAKTVTTTTTITVGAKDKGGYYPVRISGSPYLVRVTGAALGSVVGKKEADFLVKPKQGSSGAGGSGSAISGLRPVQPGSSTGSTGH